MPQNSWWNPGNPSEDRLGNFFDLTNPGNTNYSSNPTGDYSYDRSDNRNRGRGTNTGDAGRNSDRGRNNPNDRDGPAGFTRITLGSRTEPAGDSGRTIDAGTIIDDGKGNEGNVGWIDRMLDGPGSRYGRDREQQDAADDNPARDIYQADYRPNWDDVRPAGGDEGGTPEEEGPEQPPGGWWLQGGEGGGTDTPSGLVQTTLGGVNVPGAEYLSDVPNISGPTFWNVTGEELVENRMADLFESGSPVLQAWQEKTRRAHAKYGGQNSLMAQQAAVAGLAEMAFNIAATDAQTIARSREFNAAMANQYGLAQQAFVYNALLSDQNYRQALLIQREQLGAQIKIASMQVGAQMARIRADMQIAREGFQHATEMAWLNHGFSLELLNSEYGLMMGRDELQADLNLRNTLEANAQLHGFNLESLYYQNVLGDWRSSRDWQRQRILNYDQYRVDLMRMGSGLLTELGIQPGMSTTVINARLNDFWRMIDHMGLGGDNFYLNGIAQDGGGYDYFSFPPPGSHSFTGSTGGNQGRGSNGITIPGTDRLRGGG